MKSRHNAGVAMPKSSFVIAGLAAAVVATFISFPAQAADKPKGIDAIDTVVVIYAENRSFDNLYGRFPGANGLAEAKNAAPQIDRNGKALGELPPVWKGLTGEGVTPVISEADTKGRRLPNAPFAIDDPEGFNLPLKVATRDLVHKFYQNQMQIDGGKNDGFVAYGDSGALVMGHYDGSKLPLWKIAQKYTLADNFFMGAFGGSFLNHFWLICACTPVYPDADKGSAKDKIAALDADGVSLKLAPDSPVSALDGPPKFVNDGSLTPDFHAINTMQPAYQPSANPLAPGDNSAFPSSPKTLPPQSEETIGDLLNKKDVSWAWYAGGWAAALKLGAKACYTDPLNFQCHHQPFNYFADMAPGTDARAKHLLDGGLKGAAFIQAIDRGKLPQVTFYKPQGELNEHPGYADVVSGDDHLVELVRHIEKSPQFAHMLVVITYDENGGFWDHAAPPKGDRWGPGTRIPAIIISPYAKKGAVDKTFYDTTSILRFITKRFDLPELPGLKSRADALVANGNAAPGDLTNALNLPQ
jgi:phospholipase C